MQGSVNGGFDDSDEAVAGKSFTKTDDAKSNISISSSNDISMDELPRVCQHSKIRCDCS